MLPPMDRRAAHLLGTESPVAAATLPLHKNDGKVGRRKPQKWRKMAKLNRRRRWRGPALRGRLQRRVRFCFSAHDGEATTPTLTEWARPKIVHAGRRPTAVQMVNQARALRSIGAKRVRRAGRGWVWRLSDSEAE
jgi:hypothetical protein